MRKFYLVSQKSQTSGFFSKGQTSGFLTWSHYLEILRADDPLEIAFYAKECENSKWSVRELHRQMQSMLFHRIALSRDVVYASIVPGHGHHEYRVGGTLDVDARRLSAAVSAFPAPGIVI